MSDTNTDTSSGSELEYDESELDWLLLYAQTLRHTFSPVNVDFLARVYERVESVLDQELPRGVSARWFGVASEFSFILYILQLFTLNALVMQRVRNVLPIREWTLDVETGTFELGEDYTAELDMKNNASSTLSHIVQLVYNAFSTFDADLRAMIRDSANEYSHVVSALSAYHLYALQRPILPVGQRRYYDHSNISSMVMSMLPRDFSFGTYLELSGEDEKTPSAGIWCMQQDLARHHLNEKDKVSIIMRLVEYKLITWFYSRLPPALQTISNIEIIRILAERTILYKNVRAHILRHIT